MTQTHSQLSRAQSRLLILSQNSLHQAELPLSSSSYRAHWPPGWPKSTPPPKLRGRVTLRPSRGQDLSGASSASGSKTEMEKDRSGLERQQGLGNSSLWVQAGEGCVQGGPKQGQADGYYQWGVGMGCKHQCPTKEGRWDQTPGCLVSKDKKGREEHLDTGR